MKTETWYVLEDGTKADPKDVAPDDSGALRHSSGVAVAMRGDVPRTSGTGEPAAKVREVKAAKAKGEGYQTRAGGKE
jgi:hypothetical protein